MGRKKTKPTQTEILQGVINEYAAAHPGESYRMKEIAAWAYRTGRLAPKPTDAITLMAKELSRAAREEYFEDAQGRRVRRKHARRETVFEDGVEKQQVFWDDILTAPPEHMRMALQQRRMAIVWDAKQHKTDTESYNDNNKHGATLEFDYNINEDLAELELGTDYPDERPSDEEDEDSGDSDGGVLT